MLFHLIFAFLFFSINVQSSDSPMDCPFVEFGDGVVKKISTKLLDDKFEDTYKINGDVHVNLSFMNPTSNEDFFLKVLNKFGERIKSFTCEKSNISDSDLKFLEKNLPKSIEILNLKNNDYCNLISLRHILLSMKNIKKLFFGVCYGGEVIKSKNMNIKFPKFDFSETVNFN